MEHTDTKKLVESLREIASGVLYSGYFKIKHSSDHHRNLEEVRETLYGLPPFRILQLLDDILDHIGRSGECELKKRDPLYMGIEGSIELLTSTLLSSDERVSSPRFIKAYEGDGDEKNKLEKIVESLNNLVSEIGFAGYFSIQKKDTFYDAVVDAIQVLTMLRNETPETEENCLVKVIRKNATRKVEEQIRRMTIRVRIAKILYEECDMKFDDGLAILENIWSTTGWSGDKTAWDEVKQ